MNSIFLIGTLGAVITVLGVAWPSPKHTSSPYCTKNYVFAVGNSLMFAYAVLQYTQGGTLFFVLLECLVVIATILMFASKSDTINTYILTLSGAVFVGWSLYISKDVYTILFIIGLTILCLGYSFTINTLRRYVAFTVGSLCIAIFSYLEANWIFFALNIFFAVFSGWYLLLRARNRTK